MISTAQPREQGRKTPVCVCTCVWCRLYCTCFQSGEGSPAGQPGLGRGMVLVGIGVALGQAAEPWRSREEEEEKENSRGSVSPWQMVKLCCGQICSGMCLSLFPLKSPVFPGSHIGISVPQMCKNQQLSSRHGRLSSAVPLGQQQGWASILPPHPVSPPHLCAQCALA